MEKEYKIGKDILKTMLKTIVAVIIALFFAGLGFYVVNPRLSAKVCSNLGWKKAEISCYELLYARNKDNSDLYNLIVKLGDTREYQKQVDYINKLQASDSYTEFCGSMDNSVLDNFNNNKINAKNLSLLYGTNEYLQSREIINLLKLEKFDEAYNSCLQTKQSDGVYELVVYNYVEYLYALNISEEVKSNYFNLIKINFSNYLQTKQANLSATNNATTVLASYTKLKIEYTEYLIALQTLESTNQEVLDCYANWQTAQTEYNNLIK